MKKRVEKFFFLKNEIIEMLVFSHNSARLLKKWLSDNERRCAEFSC